MCSISIPRGYMDSSCHSSSLISGWGSSTFLTDLPTHSDFFCFDQPHRDQMCSLSFSLTNLYFMGCVYVTGFNSSWDTTCNTRSPHWGIHFLLACSPYFCRLVQSLRRWHDSRLGAHLINASSSSYSRRTFD